MSTEADTSQRTQSQEIKDRFPVSRRDVIVKGSTTISLLAVAGPAAAEGDSSKSSSSSEQRTLTVFVTGLEVEGAMADVMVRNGVLDQMTDDSGKATFDLEDGTYEITVEKDGWGSETRTITMGGEDQEVHFPLHTQKFNDLTFVVCSASHGGPIENAEVTVSGFGTIYTDRGGETMAMVERMMEPTEHEITVSADGYHTESRQTTLGADKHLRVELVSK